MKIGIYGGTFNPPHLGHFTAAQVAVGALALDRLILMPSAIPPHKDLPADAVDQKHRFAMTELMADGMGLPECVAVSAIEMNRGGASYTVDTLKELKGLYPEAEFWLLMGTDMFLTVHQWKQPAEILKQANICTFRREEKDNADTYGIQKAMLENEFGANVMILDHPQLVEVSSTELRNSLAEGNGTEHLLQTVYGYILRHHLYGVNDVLTQLDDTKLRAASYSMVKAKRIPHIKGTEEEAVRLARHWGIDEHDARRAAILHDCTKYWTLEQHLELCDAHAIQLDDWERSTVKLLHAKSGAGVAKYIFGESNAVYSAILWHTTGKGHMTMLEKIIYTADFMEPNRVFDGVDEMRTLAYTNLDAAILMGIQMTIDDMQARKRHIHTKTQEARDFLQGH